MVNEITLQLLCKLLELPESDTTVSELRTTSDIELLLDLILHVCEFHSAWSFTSDIV